MKIKIVEYKVNFKKSHHLVVIPSLNYKSDTYMPAIPSFIKNFIYIEKRSIMNSHITSS